MQLSQRAYTFMNTFAIFAPIVSAVLAAASYENAINGLYWVALFVAVPVILCLLAARLIRNPQFYIGTTIMMFTCNLMNVIFFHMPGSSVMIISILLLQLFIAVPALLYGLAIRLIAQRGTP